MTRAELIAARFHAAQDMLLPGLRSALGGFFRAQARRVLERWMSGAKAISSAGLEVKADAPEAPDLLPDSERAALAKLLEPWLIRAFTVSGELASALAGAPPLLDNDPALLALLAESGDLIRSITDETRDAVREVLAEGASRGYGQYYLAGGRPSEGFRGLREVVTEAYKGRAETIARTELAVASNHAAADRYGAAGVQWVDIIDGPECGWRSHDDPDKANRTRRLLADFRAHVTAHPNCRRVGVPTVKAS